MNLPRIRGRAAFIFDAPNFDIDLIVGIKNIKVQDIGQLRETVMHAYDADFVSKVAVGDVLIGGPNFGFGHPHYQPMLVMRHLGIKAVIAESFFPLYRRSETCEGFPQISCPGILGMVQRWDEIEVAWEAGEIVNHTRKVSLPFEVMSRKDLSVIAAGGVVHYLKQDLNRGA